MPTAALKKNRPKYLSLRAIVFEIRLPLAGWVSILHRVSGALLFVSLVWLLYMLETSLSSEQGFTFVKHYLGLLPVKIALLVLVWAYCHHLCAGIRYLLLELQRGWEKQAARRTSVAVFVVSLVLTGLFGWKLW